MTKKCHDGPCGACLYWKKKEPIAEQRIDGRWAKVHRTNRAGATVARMVRKPRK